MIQKEDNRLFNVVRYIQTIQHTKLSLIWESPARKAYFIDYVLNSVQLRHAFKLSTAIVGIEPERSRVFLDKKIKPDYFAFDQLDKVYSKYDLVVCCDYDHVGLNSGDIRFIRNMVSRREKTMLMFITDMNTGISWEHTADLDYVEVLREFGKHTDDFIRQHDTNCAFEKDYLHKVAV